MAPCIYCGGDLSGQSFHINCSEYFQHIRWDDEYKDNIKAAVEHIKGIRLRNIQNNREADELAASARLFKRSLVKNDRLQQLSSSGACENIEATGERSPKRRCRGESSAVAEFPAVSERSSVVAEFPALAGMSSVVAAYSNDEGGMCP